MKLSHKVSNVSTVSNVSGVLSKTKYTDIQSNHFINDLTHLTHNTHLFTKARAFTLAEVLITLGIIGVVAAITMPTLITNINERINSERQANIVHKITQAMEHMRALGKLTQYESTEAFVNELKNHLKISKICYKDNIAECWPTETVIDKDGNEYNVADAKTGADLNKNTTTNNVGLILADGASIILNYDNTDKGLDVGDPVTASTKSLPVGANKSKDFPYSSTVTDSIDFIMDVNGKGNPNKEMDKNNKYYDIRSFKTASFTKGALWENGTAGEILYLGQTYTSLDCSNPSNPDYIYCGSTPSGFPSELSGGNLDYWAGAQKACQAQGGTLPSVSKLYEIGEHKSEYPSITSYDGTFAFWADEEYDQRNAYSVIPGLGDGADHKSTANQVLCVK